MVRSDPSVQNLTEELQVKHLQLAAGSGKTARVVAVDFSLSYGSSCFDGDHAVQVLTTWLQQIVSCEKDFDISQCLSISWPDQPTIDSERMTVLMRNDVNM